MDFQTLFANLKQWFITNGYSDWAARLPSNAPIISNSSPSPPIEQPIPQPVGPTQYNPPDAGNGIGPNVFYWRLPQGAFGDYNPTYNPGSGIFGANYQVNLQAASVNGQGVGVSMQQPTSIETPNIPWKTPTLSPLTAGSSNV